jgi:hypothetical protein
MRAKVEHVFWVLKCQFGYRKVRYRGIAKNGAKVFALLALLAGWDVSSALYLALRLAAQSDQSHIRRRAQLQDEGRIAMLVLTAIAAYLRAPIGKCPYRATIRPLVVPSGSGFCPRSANGSILQAG